MFAVLTCLQEPDGLKSSVCVYIYQILICDCLKTRKGGGNSIPRR